MPDLISAKPTCDKITEKILINKATASIGALCLVMFLRMGGVFIVLPLISVYAGGLVGGGDAFVAGMALGAYGITQAFMQIPAGLLADRWGRKPVMATALLLFAIGGFSAAAAQTVEALILARLLQGVGAVASVASAWLADVSPAEHRTRAMAVFGSAIALAFMISIFTAIPLAGAVGIKGVFCAHRLCRPLGVCHYPFDAVAGALRRHRRFFLDFTKNHWRRLKSFRLRRFCTALCAGNDIPVFADRLKFSVGTTLASLCAFLFSIATDSRAVNLFRRPPAPPQSCSSLAP